MSKIRAKDTKPEMLVRKFFFSKGFRYRLHEKDLPGKPDMVFQKYKTILFIHGCFWHSHEGCRYYVVPKTKTNWWLAKINGNKAKDADSIMKLEQLGWKVIVVWACELKPGKVDDLLQNLLKEFKSTNEFKIY